MNYIHMKTKIYFGKNSLEYLTEILSKKILIICDPFLVKNGAIKDILIQLDNSNDVIIFDNVVPDPNLDVIGSGLTSFIKQRPDIVIGFGGGSAIDTAKGIIYFARINNYAKDTKLIAIPTTSGTGSEVTSATVITDTKENVKHIVFDECILPDEAILDSRFTLTIPKNITANTGLDVLTHALEAYVSKGANNYSDALAEKAVELVMKSLLKCYFCGIEEEYREDMHEASTIAGTAFNIAGLGISHSIAHQLGGTFCIPHGLANAILLPYIIKFNSKDKSAIKKYASIVYKTGMVEKEQGDEFAVNVLICYIRQIEKIMNMPLSLKEYGILKESFDLHKNNMAENAIKDNCTSSNPVDVTRFDIETLLEYIY